MGGRLIAAMASTMLAVPAGAVAGPPLLQPDQDPAEVPCPVAELTDPPERPPPPDPPAHRPGDRELGGAPLATAGLVVPAEAPELPGDLSATSWLVADLVTGEVLGGCGPHQYGVPASTQKLLLAAALLPELDPDEVVEVTLEDLDIEPGSSAVGLVLGGEYPIETLWLGLLLNSGNDAANVLARLGGGEDGRAGGVRAMNQQAQQIGAYQTHAVTPSGLDGPGQFTSAYDLALITRVLFDRSDFQRYVATARVEIPAQPDQDAPGFQIQNQNDLLTNYPGALGGKTGFTDLARHSFVGAAEQDGRRLVVTLLGAELVPQPTWRQAAALLDWGFSLPADESVGRLVEPDELAERDTSSVGSPSPSPATGPGGAGPPGASAATPAGTISLTAVAGAVLALAGLVTLVSLLVTGRRRRRSGTVAR